jgi:hypothetical protein
MYEIEGCGGDYLAPSGCRLFGHEHEDRQRTLSESYYFVQHPLTALVEKARFRNKSFSILYCDDYRNGLNGFNLDESTRVLAKEGLGYKQHLWFVVRV